MASFPLFIVGAPRSGTTFLCSLLNRHPSIGLTNENRIFVLLKQMLEVDSGSPEFLNGVCRERFVDFSRRTFGAWVERFYREGLDISAPIWGDKHPPYADRTVLSGRTGSTEHLPRSGSCLHLIRELLPEARFIHIHREPGQVAESLVRKQWIGSFEDGVRVWAQYVEEIGQFFDTVPPAQQLTLPYRHLIETPAAAVAELGRFLELSDMTPVRDFLAAQRETPEPFSEPVRDVAEIYASPSGRTDARYLAIAGQPAVDLGYAGA